MAVDAREVARKQQQQQHTCCSTHTTSVFSSVNGLQNVCAAHTRTHTHAHTSHHASARVIRYHCCGCHRNPSPMRYKQPRAAGQQPLARCDQSACSVIVQCTFSKRGHYIKGRPKQHRTHGTQHRRTQHRRTFSLVEHNQRRALQQHARKTKQLLLAAAGGGGWKAAACARCSACVGVCSDGCTC